MMCLTLTRDLIHDEGALLRGAGSAGSAAGLEGIHRPSLRFFGRKFYKSWSICYKFMNIQYFAVLQ